MIGILFSDVQTADPFIQKYERGRFSELEEGEYEDDGHVLVSVSGVGKIKATLRTERLLQKVKLDTLIQVGACFSLSGEHAIGSLVNISQVFEGDRIELATPTYPRMPLRVLESGSASGTMVTQDHIPKTSEEMNYWQRMADFSDSVGYAVAFVTASFGIPCHIVKAVASKSGEDDPAFRKNLAKCQESLADHLLKEIPKILAAR